MLQNTFIWEEGLILSVIHWFVCLTPIMPSYININHIQRARDYKSVIMYVSLLQSTLKV